MLAIYQDMIFDEPLEELVRQLEALSAEAAVAQSSLEVDRAWKCHLHGLASWQVLLMASMTHPGHHACSRSTPASAPLRSRCTS